MQDNSAQYFPSRASEHAIRLPVWQVWSNREGMLGLYLKWIRFCLSGCFTVSHYFSPDGAPAWLVFACSRKELSEVVKFIYYNFTVITLILFAFPHIMKWNRKESFMIDYIAVKEAAEKWKISERRVQKLCEENRIEGVVRFGRSWMIPRAAAKPDMRQRGPKPKGGGKGNHVEAT